MSLGHRRAKYRQRVYAGAAATACVVLGIGASAPTWGSSAGAGATRCPVPVHRLRVEVWGFTAPWDPRSAASVACVAPALRVVISGWLRLDSLTALPVAVYPDTIKIPNAPHRFALVTTYQRDRFHRETITRLAGDSVLRAHAAGAVAAWAARHGYQGLVLDFEALTRDDTAALATVVKAFVDSAHARHVRPVTVAVVPTDTLVYAGRHLEAADLLLAMLYDEHWANGAPGPIASPGWFRQALALRVAEVGASRLVAGLPTYGYLWRRPATTAVLSYADAQRHAAQLRIRLSRDSASGTLHFAGPDSAEAWVADAALTHTLVASAESLGVRRFALWRLGLEDPAIWTAAFGRK